MKHCIQCDAKEPHFTLPGSAAAVCSDTCLRSYLLALVEAMSEAEAHRRLGELRAKCAAVDGRRGGLLVEEADLAQLLAQRLGVSVEWGHFDLKSFEVKEGRGG